jgi:hypothetical protein
VIKFKILDTATGLYSHGGYTPIWSNRGKSWDSRKNVCSYLSAYRTMRGRKVTTSWVVVELKVTLTEVNRTAVKDLLVEPSLPVIHVSGKDICRRKSRKESRYKSQKKTGKRSKD